MVSTSPFGMQDVAACKTTLIVPASFGTSKTTVQVLEMINSNISNGYSMITTIIC